MPEIRQHDHYSLRNTIRAGCIEEFCCFFNELANGVGVADLRRKLADGQILSHFAHSTRLALWKIFRTRYLNIDDPWVQSELVRASQHGPDAPEFVSLLYLYFLLRDRLAFEFVVEDIWRKWSDHDLSIGTGDASAYLARLSRKTDALSRITAASKGKLTRNTISTLQEYVFTGAVNQGESLDPGQIGFCASEETVDQTCEQREGGLGTKATRFLE